MSGFLKILAVIILILGIIGSMILGSSTGGATFNLGLAISGLLGTLLSFGALYAFGQVVEYLSSAVISLSSIDRKLKNNDNIANASEKMAPQGNHPKSSTEIKASLAHGMKSPGTRMFVVCKGCGEDNPAGKLYCINCGKRIK